MRKLARISILPLLLAVLLPTASFAQTSVDINTETNIESNSNNSTVVEDTVTINGETQTFRSEGNNINRNLQIQSNGEETVTTLDETVDGQRRTQTLRNTMRTQIQSLKLQNKAEVDAKRAAFQEKIQTLTNTQKQQIVERIDANLTKANENATNKMFDYIEKLEDILMGIEEDATSEASTAAIEEAKSALETAKTTVANQAAKEYVIEIIDEGSLRNTVGMVISGLKSDLRSTYESVKIAKQTVRAAAKSTIQQTTPTGTGTGTSSGEMNQNSL